MSVAEKLAGLLRKVNTGEKIDEVKGELKQFVEGIDPVELSLAEQTLIEQGTDPVEMRHLCVAHLEVLDGQINQVRSKLKESHMLDTLYEEHDEILRFLEMLDQVNARIQRERQFQPDNRDYTLLHHLAEHLVGAEKHHAREEQVLFPALDRLGVTGPTRIMRMEHDELRVKKHRLLELAETVGPSGFREFQKQVDEAAKYIVFHLRDHIFKENTILYPTAIDLIKDEAEWDRMKKAADEIGYCCFTPGH